MLGNLPIMKTPQSFRAPPTFLGNLGNSALVCVVLRGARTHPDLFPMEIPRSCKGNKFPFSSKERRTSAKGPRYIWWGENRRLVDVVRRGCQDPDPDPSRMEMYRFRKGIWITGCPSWQRAARFLDKEPDIYLVGRKRATYVTSGCVCYLSTHQLLRLPLSLGHL